MIDLQSGAKINISDGSCPERIVTVTGPTQSIYKAFTLICKKFEEVKFKVLKFPSCSSPIIVTAFAQKMWNFFVFRLGIYLVTSKTTGAQSQLKLSGKLWRQPPFLFPLCGWWRHGGFHSEVGLSSDLLITSSKCSHYDISYKMVKLWFD